MWLICNLNVFRLEEKWLILIIGLNKIASWPKIILESNGLNSLHSKSKGNFQKNMNRKFEKTMLIIEQLILPVLGSSFEAFECKIFVLLAILPLWKPLKAAQLED